MPSSSTRTVDDFGNRFESELWALLQRKKPEERHAARNVFKNQSFVHLIKISPVGQCQWS